MSNVDELLDQAFFAYNQKEYDTAQELARNALTLSPTNGDGLYLLGLIAIESNAFEPAERLLYQAVKFYPEQNQYKLSLAFVLEKQGRLDEALSFYDPLKEDPFVLSQIGFIYLKKGQVDFAKSAFDKAIEKDTHVSTAYIGKALILRGQGENEQALDILLVGEGNAPSAELFYQKAITYRLMQKPTAGLREIEKALALEKKAAFYNEKGLNEEGLCLIQNAKLSYEQALEKNAYCADAYANLGNIYLKENNLIKAEDAYKRALGIDKDFLNAHHNLALLLYKQGRLNEALEHFRSVILINPKHQEGLYNLAIILEETGDYSEAAGMYFNLLSNKKEIKDLELRIQNVLSLMAKEDKKLKKQAKDFAKGWVKSFENSVVAKVTYASLFNEKISQELAKSYAELLYDNFAPTYDDVIEKLESKALEKITQLIPNGAKHILDLGCGTGALADRLSFDYEALVGVDISIKMLEKAKEKQLYTRLIHQDIASFLTKEESKFDLIVASDVTPYFEDIALFLQGVKNHLTEQGTFLFTIEIGANENVTLSENSRFIYNPEYVKTLLEKTGFSIDTFCEMNLRKEGNGFARGVVIKALKKPELLCVKS